MASRDPMMRWIVCATRALGCTHNDFADPSCVAVGALDFPARRA